ncbi:MAG: DUF1834 family protein [Azonexus sp.]|jgi:hypothetical protein|nr:DUF1834 family protein [Azonexus sp.]
MLAECEDGLIALIKNAPLGQRLAVVGALPGVDGEALVRRFGAEAPAVYIAPGQIEVKEGACRLYFALGCVARNSRGQEAARKGDGMAIGLYQMVEAVAALADCATAGGINWSVVGIDYLNEATLADNQLHVAVVRLVSSGWILLPPALDETALAAFKVFRESTDIEPHEGQAEHRKWAGDPPDHTTSAPDVAGAVILQE